VKSLPCSAFKVKGTPVVEDAQKAGFKKLQVIKEIPQNDLDELFGFKYLEASHPIHPFKLKPPEIGEEHIKLLQDWASVGDSVRASVWTSVWDSVGDSVGDSVWASAGASAGASVRASVYAYIGSLFPSIKTWKYCENVKAEGYPFQPEADLWKQGLVVSFDGKDWRLHGGEKAETLYKIGKKGLRG
jgi:hypothetical protein